jgi:hypothetical protein
MAKSAVFSTRAWKLGADKREIAASGYSD